MDNMFKALVELGVGDVTPWFWPTFDVEEANGKGDIMREEE